MNFMHLTAENQGTTVAVRVNLDRVLAYYPRLDGGNGSMLEIQSAPTVLIVRESCSDIDAMVNGMAHFAGHQPGSTFGATPGLGGGE